jgi:hypothetical protein
LRHPGPAISVVAVLVAVPLVIAAAVGLPLFQDGSSYLLELMVSQSAVRHHRYAVLLIQAPSILALRLSDLAGLDPRSALQLVGAVFRLSYAAVPFVALAWSWLLVRRRETGHLLWAATPILLLNAINFSAVSEILLAMQLSCPLMLAAYQRNPTRSDIATIVILTPIIFLLHALVPLLLLGLATGMLIRAGRVAAVRPLSLPLAATFASMAVLRLVLDAWLLTDYERNMLEAAQLAGYFSTRFENAAFLAVATSAALWFAFGRRAEPTTAAAGTLGVRPPTDIRLSFADKVALLLPWLAALAVVAGFATLDHFPLKTGTTVVIAAVLFACAGYDTTRDLQPLDVRRRSAFVLSAAGVFALIVLCKAVTWHGATSRLGASLAASGLPCIEIDDPSMHWLRQPPDTILDNWSLPSLVLVSTTLERPALLLQAGDCARFAQNGEIVVDPWTVLPARALPFVFGSEPAGRGR